MAFEDLNPYSAAGLKSFGSRTLSAMDASPDIPRVDENYAGYGVNQLDVASADSAALGQALTTPTNIQQPPSVGFNEATNQMFVNGLTFDVDDYQTADRSATPEYLNRTPTGLPEGFSQLSPDAFGSYINSIRDPGKGRLMSKNFGIGVDNLQMLLGAGTAFVGDTLGSETISNYGREVIKNNQEDLRRKEPFQRTFTDDVVKEGEVVDWFLGNLAQQGPNLIESMAAFLVGSTVATVAQGNPVTGVLSGVGAALGKGQIKKRLMDILAKKQRGEALDAGEQALVKGVAGIAASIGNNYRTGVSDVYLELLESAEMKDPGAGQRLAALAAGVPYAAAETLSEAFVVSKFLNPSATSSVFKRIGKAFFGGAVAEGLAEGVQESTVMGTDAALNEKELLTEQNGLRLINAIAAGAAVGGPISGVSGFRGGNQEVNLLDNQQPPPETQQEGPIQGELFPDDDLGTAPVPEGPPQGELFPPETDFGVGAEFPVGSGNIINPQLNLFDQPVIPSRQPGFQMELPFPTQGVEPTNFGPQQELPLTAPVGTQTDLFNQNLPFPEQERVPIPTERDPVQLPLPMDMPRQRRPDNIFVEPEPELRPTEEVIQDVVQVSQTDNIKQSTTEFNPSVTPQLQNRRDKKDLPATAKGENQISGGKQEDRITDPTLRKASFDKINYVAPDMGVIPPQVMQDKYAAAMRKIKLVDSKKKGNKGTNWKGAHHNGGVAIVSSYPYSQPITADLIAHELGHASHSLLGDQINNNPEVLAELQVIEQLLYPGLRAAIEQAINNGKKLDNEFFNYLLSPEELIAEFNVFRLKQPGVARVKAPVLSALLESVEQAPDLVIDRKTFPTGFGTIVTKATGNFNGDLNFSQNQRQQRSQARAVKRQRQADQLKKGVKKEEEQDAVQEPEATQVDAQEQTQDGERVGEEVQETPRARTKKKSLKKEKVEEQSVQADTQPKPEVKTKGEKLKAKTSTKDKSVTRRVYTDDDGVERTQLIDDSGRVVTDMVGTAQLPKRLRLKSGNFVRVTGAAAATQTKTPQRVEKPKAVETPLNKKDQWDANRPDEDAPKREDFPKNLRGELDNLSAEEARDAWTDPTILEKLPDLVAAKIIIYSLDRMTLPKKGTLQAQNMQQMFTLLLDLALPSDSKNMKEAREWLADFKLRRTEFRDAVTTVVPPLLTIGALDTKKETLWFDLAVNVGALPALKRQLKTDASVANYNKMERSVFSSEQIIDANIQTNEQELTSFGGMSAAVYNDSKKGPVAIAKKLALLLSSLDASIIKSPDNPVVAHAERLYNGTSKVKPDLTYEYKGRPLKDYFDASGKLKLREYNSTTINRLGNKVPISGFKMSPVDMQTNRTQNQEAKETLADDKKVGETQRDIDVTQDEADAQERFEAALSGYFGERAKQRALEQLALGERKVFNPRSKGARLKKGAVPIIDQDFATFNMDQAKDDPDLQSFFDQVDAKTEDGNTLIFDGDKPIKTMSVGKATLLAKSFINKLANKPTLTVVKDLADLKAKKPALFERILAARPEIETTNISGMSIGKEVIVFSDFIKGERHLRFTLAHEAMGHFGLRSLVKESELHKFLDGVYNDSDYLRNRADEYMELHGTSRYVAIEEAIANYAGSLETSTLSKIWMFIDKLLSKIGIKLFHDDAPYIVNQLRRYVRDGEIPGGVSADQIAANVAALNDSKVGMFSINYHNMATTSLGEMFQSSGKSTIKEVVQAVGKRKFLDNAGRAAEQVQTLDNMANKSLGLTLMFDIFRRQAQTAKSIMSELDSVTKAASRARWFGLNKNALTKEEEKTVGKLLAYGNQYAAQQLDEATLKDLPDVIIQDAVTGRPIVNQATLAIALDSATLTDDQIRNGFDIEMAGVSQPAPIKIPDFDPVNNQRHKLIKEAYMAQREAVNYASARVALGKYLSSIKQYEANRQRIKQTSEQFTNADLDIFDQISQIFTKIYQQGARDSDGKARPTTKAIRDAEAFLNGVTRALWQDGAIQDLEAMQTSDNPTSKEQTKLAINVINQWNSKFPDDQIDITNIVAGLKRMRRYDINDPATELGSRERTREKIIMAEIQQPMKNQVFTETQLINANHFAKGTMFSAYVPFRRNGKNQLRFQAIGENGKPTKINAMFANAFPYYQDDNRTTLENMRDEFNEGIKDTVFQVPASDDPDAPLVSVRMEAVVEDASGGASSITSFNYDEFANVLNNLGVQLSLEERERIVIELSKQHDKARSGLMKDFVPGWDDDVFRSIAEHLESQAAIAAKNEHRTDIDVVMATDSNWRMPKAKVEEQYRELERARASGNVELANVAQEKFDKILRMYLETGSDGPSFAFTYIDKYGKERTLKPKGKHARYKDKAAELLEFYAQTGDIAISAEDMFSKSDLLSQFKSLAVLFQLGGNIASGLVNTTSLPLMALPLLATYNQHTGIGGGYGFTAAGAAITRAVGNLKGMSWGDPSWIKENVLDNNSHASYGLSKDEAQFLYRQTQRGILDAALVNSLAGRARGNFFQNGTATAVSRGYMSVFAYTEQLNRRVTALATYRLEKKRRMAADPTLKQDDFLLDTQLQDTVLLDENPDLFYIEDKVNEMVTKSQGDYAMYNRPPIARGNWAQYLYMYKQFQVIATQLVRVLPPSGRAYYLGMLFAVAGLKGLPGAEDLLDIVDTLRQKFGGLFGYKGTVPAEIVLGQVISDMTGGIITPQEALRGGLDKYMGGGTIGSRLSVGDLFPLTGVFLDGASVAQELKNFAGPLYSAASGGVTMAYDLAMLPTKGNVGNELLRIGQNSPIAGLRNLADTAMYMQTGDIVNARGYTVSKDVGTGTTVMRMLGFYPKDASKVNDAIRITKRIVDNQKAITKGYRDEWVRAYLLRDKVAMRDVERAVREHNKVYRRTPFFIDDFRGKAERAAKSAKEGAGARFLKTTPKSTREAINDIIENFYDVKID